MFGKAVPEYFGDPLISIYSLFKVFTVEGWFEIPDKLAERGISGGIVVLVRCYFIIAVIVGGILGLSLANAIFVDEMTADNTYRLEGMVENLQEQVNDIQTSIKNEQHTALSQIQSELAQMRKMVENMQSRRN